VGATAILGATMKRSASDSVLVQVQCPVGHCSALSFGPGPNTTVRFKRIVARGTQRWLREGCARSGVDFAISACCSSSTCSPPSS
jgi:hypothetical protein